MKTKIGYILMFILVVLFGCDRKDKVGKETDINVLKKPETTYLTETQIQNYVDKEINLAIDLGNENVIKEAADVILLTRSVLSFIIDEDYAEAIETINKAIAKAELITLGNNAKVISEVNIEIPERVKDAESAQRLIHRIDSLFQNGELQKAKNLMSQLTSELRITRESISVSSYLQTLRKTEQFMKSKQYDRARLELNSILGNVTVERSITPLPLIIARKMVLEMEKLINEQNPNEENIRMLLKNAEYQVRFSELLGYGKSENEYQDIYMGIKNIRKNLEEENRKKVQNLVSDLSDDIKQLQKDISEYKQVNMNMV